MSETIDRNVVAMIARSTGSSLLPDNDQWTNRMEIRSKSSSRLYVVSQNKKTGTWGCSCPSWCTRRTCAHLKAMVPLLTAGASQGNRTQPMPAIEGRRRA